MEWIDPDPSTDPQSELVRRYCAEARRLVSRARDAAEARQIQERYCSRLAKVCSSSLVLTATRIYIDEFIKEQWGVDQEYSNRLWGL